MRGCLMLIIWTPFSLMTAGGLLGQQLYNHYPYSPKPSTLPTREESLAYAVFGMFWLAGIALMITLNWLWRAARGDTEVDGRSAIIVALAWGLLTGWLTAGIKPLFISEPARYWDGRLWTWSVSGPVELIFLPSFGVLLWCGGLRAMLLAVRSVWRWLPEQ